MDAQILWFNFWLKKEIFLFSNASRLAVGAIQPPMQWLPGGVLHPWRHGRQGTAYHSPPTSDEVKNEWCYTSTLSMPSWHSEKETLPLLFLAAMHSLHSPRWEDERIYR
jgi:hypothetical protein